MKAETRDLNLWHYTKLQEYRHNEILKKFLSAVASALHINDEYMALVISNGKITFEKIVVFSNANKILCFVFIF